MHVSHQKIKVYHLTIGRSIHKLSRCVETEYKILCLLDYLIFNISDSLLLRRIEMVAKYDIRCSLLTDNVVLSTLTTVANGYVNQIRKICQGGEWAIVSA